jgi:hypothetical protein
VADDEVRQEVYPGLHTAKAMQVLLPADYSQIYPLGSKGNVMKYAAKTPIDDLTVQQLNYCAAKLEGYKYIHVFHHQVMVSNKKHESYDYNPCENANRAYGIIIEYGIGTEQLEMPDGNNWCAFTGSSECYSGTSPLHAATKCYVAEYGVSKVSDWLEEMARGGNE